MAFAEDFAKLNSSERNQFSETLDNLLFHCFVVRKKYDRTTGIDKISYDYNFIERHFSLIEDYLSYLGLALSKDDDTGVIFIKSDLDKNRQRVDTATTLVIYALRAHYEEALSKAPNNLEVAMDSNQLRQTLSDLGLSTAAKRLTLQTVSGAMKTLASFNVIARNKGSFNDAAYSFYILPAIRYVISNDKLNALYRYLTGNPTDEEVHDDGLFGVDDKNEPEPRGF